MISACDFPLADYCGRALLINQNSLICVSASHFPVHPDVRNGKAIIIELNQCEIECILLLCVSGIANSRLRFTATLWEAPLSFVHFDRTDNTDPISIEG